MSINLCWKPTTRCYNSFHRSQRRDRLSMLDLRVLLMVTSSFLPSLFKLFLFVAGVNAGHLPGSFSIPYTDVFDQSNQCLKSNDDLQRRNRSVTSFLSLTGLLLLRSSVLQRWSRSIQRRHLYVSIRNNSEYLSVCRSCPRSKVSLRL